MPRTCSRPSCTRPSASPSSARPSWPSTGPRPTTCGRSSCRSRTGPWPRWSERSRSGSRSSSRPRSSAEVNAALFVSIFVVATCGLVYELVAGALASYLLGDTVLQFSTVIGTYLFAMGVGSYLSRFVGKGLAARFIQLEALVGLVGGFSAAALFAAFAHVAGFRLVLYGVVLVVGALVGMELPLLMRLLKSRIQFKDLVSQVLALDYIGALGASLLFPLWLAPRLGLLNTSLVFGLLNVLVALWALHVFREELPGARWLRTQCLGAAGLLIGGLAFSAEIGAFAEESLYADEVILARSTPYQRIVLTRWKDDVRLFLNAHLQFSSRDEYRYHETLVHPGLAGHRDPRSVLILGGGDGMAAREALKDPRVKRVTLVDLDAEMTQLFARHPLLSKLNAGALSDPRLRVVNADAFAWLQAAEESFDVAIVDFPDPSNYSLGKLYSTTFYSLLRRRLNAGGLAAVQATSPLFARRSFWCIERTMKAAGLTTVPYHAYVPSFGEWGFVIGATTPYRRPGRLPPGLKFLDAASLDSLFEFPADMARVGVEPNRLNTQLLVQYYESEWRKIGN
ncbi:MAG: polyamine aminopropyltransferase [Elusimicrobia bacterium]|nr:polyamine aminopropyltransferase [Elusimicrobiota bacterium]